MGSAQVTKVSSLLVTYSPLNLNHFSYLPRLKLYSTNDELRGIIIVENKSVKWGWGNEHVLTSHFRLR